MYLRTFKQLHPGGLPLFQAKLGNRSVLYAPGHIAVITSHEMEIIKNAYQESHDKEHEPRIWIPESGVSILKVASALEEYARRIAEETRQRLETTFAPECLAIYLSNRCNLVCSYCYTKQGWSFGLLNTEMRNSLFAKGVNTANGYRKREMIASSEARAVIDEQTVRAAARLVAQNCAEKNKPFHLVLHGGGEPTLHWEQIQSIESITRRISDEFSLDWFGYIATNGVLPAKRARWLAKHFSLIGLSCDGPPDIQDQQRPLLDGGCSSVFVEHTARILTEANAEFNVRATITPQTIGRQSEIVSYLYERLGATQMRFEPVYMQSARKRIFAKEDADCFVQHFLAAQRTSQILGCELSYSGVRFDEIHGPYCNVLRDVLNLTPDGSATACFARCRGNHSDSDPFMIGYMDKAKGEFIIDQEQVAILRSLLGTIPNHCMNCVSAYHCARSCPEICQIGPSAREDEIQAPGFRCLVNRKLAEFWILEAAQSIRNKELNSRRESYQAGNREPEGRIPEVADDKTRLENLLAKMPSEIDLKAIRYQWQAAKSLLRFVRRVLPLPVWARNGFTQTDSEAWRILCHELETIECNRALSAYIHIPFCHHKCAFCDCYSQSLSRRDGIMEEKYKRALLSEMDLWARIGTLAERPVTTVHFGGGTPNCLSHSVFAQFVEHFAARFMVTPQTEWALESTSSLLTDEHLERLRSMGFKRLHVGIQTLEDHVRRIIGRREKSNQVLAKLARSIEMGFTVSVDIIYGLPQETISGFMACLEHVMETGVHGISLYQLQTSRQNRQFLERFNVAERDPIHDYVFLQVAEQLLISNGYRKTYFNHFAVPEDRNLYYSFPERGEDLLALGTIADGVFGDYHYRHREYHDYTESAMRDIPPLEGGIRETDAERMLRPATIALLAGYTTSIMLRELNAAWILENWLECALLEKSSDSQHFRLTANGSWLVKHMIEQLSRAAVFDC